MKNNLTAQLSFGQRMKMFIQKSPARMAFIIAAILYLITIIISPASLNASAIGSIIMLTLLLSFASASFSSSRQARRAVSSIFAASRAA